MNQASIQGVTDLTVTEEHTQHRVQGVSPKLAAAIGPPLTAVITAMILTGSFDRASLAALAAVLIGAALGYHAPIGDVTVNPIDTEKA